MCQTDGGVDESQRATVRDGVSQRACPSTGCTQMPVYAGRAAAARCKQAIDPGNACSTSQRRGNKSARRRQPCRKHQVVFIIPHAGNSDVLLCAVCLRGELYDYSDNGVADGKNGRDNVHMLGPVDLLFCRTCETILDSNKCLCTSMIHKGCNITTTRGREHGLTG